MSSSGSSPSRLTGSGGLSCAPGPVLIIEKRSLAFAQRLGNGRFRAPYIRRASFFGTDALERVNPRSRTTSDVPGKRPRAVIGSWRVRAVVLCLVGIVLWLPGSVQAVGEPLLIATVASESNFNLKHPNGTAVTSIAPGTYDIEVRDTTSEHNFHLTGPGVDRKTTVNERVTVVWQDVVLRASSSFRYICDPHASDMRGSFTTTGGAAPPPPPPPPPPGPPPPPPPPHVHPLQVSGVKISLERRGAKRVLVGRARVNRKATAKLTFVRRGSRRTRASGQKSWAVGPNRIQVGLPRPLASGRWTATLRVGKFSFKRTIRIG